MKRFVAITITAVAVFMLSPQLVAAQHYYRGFGGSPAFGSGFHYGSISRGFVNPGFYRPLSVHSFYRGGFHQGLNSFNRVHYGGLNRGFGFHYGRIYGRGCGW